MGVFVGVFVGVGLGVFVGVGVGVFVGVGVGVFVGVGVGVFVGVGLGVGEGVSMLLKVTLAAFPSSHEVFGRIRTKILFTKAPKPFTSSSSITLSPGINPSIQMELSPAGIVKIVGG